MTPQEILPLLQRALADHEAGRAGDAEAIYRRILAEHPDNPDALHLMGVLLTQRGKPAEALPLLHRASQVAPNFAQGHFHLGQALAELDRHNEALPCFARALQLDPRYAMVRVQAGSSLLSLGRINEALEQFRIAAQMDPNNGGFLGNYGFALYRAGKAQEALQVLRRAVTMPPVEVPVLLQLGEVLWNLQLYEEAAQVAEQAERMAPRDIRVLILLGNSYQVVARSPEAAAAYRRVIEIDSTNFDAWSNLALTLLKMSQATESLEMYEQIVSRWPDRMDALANRSLAILTLGDLGRGFKEYETRWRSAAFKHNTNFPAPRWDGADLAGKTILLTSEQGMGDVIQFIRYAPKVVARGAKVLVHCAPDLRGVIETVEGISGISHPGEKIPPIDFYAPLASLPAIFQTTLQTIPAAVPYVRADPARVARWKERLASSQGFKVGIVWAGTPLHQNDYARSSKLADFAPLVMEGVTLFSLQKGKPEAQLTNPPPGMQITPVGPDLRNFADTAALLECLDLLISVDTSVVHLAGALGRPVWTLLAKGPDWRWMLDREDSPWYPTMKLFRQREMGDWTEVMRRVSENLRQLVRL
jgi:tetratricopeptide (TPR) repeat protein